MNAALISDGDVNGIPKRSSIQLQRRGERLDRTSSGASDGEKQEIPAICLFLASSHTWRGKTSFIQFSRRTENLLEKLLQPRCNELHDRSRKKANSRAN